MEFLFLIIIFRLLFIIDIYRSYQDIFAYYIYLNDEKNPSSPFLFLLSFYIFKIRIFFFTKTMCHSSYSYQVSFEKKRKKGFAQPKVTYTFSCTSRTTFLPEAPIVFVPRLTRTGVLSLRLTVPKRPSFSPIMLVLQTLTS